VLTAQQAADLAAIADRIIPRDDTPSASEAGLVFFADQYLASIGAHDKPDFEKALAEANAAARKQVRTATSFAALTTRQQDAALQSIEDTEGFGFLRTMTVSGYLCHPMHGGNRNSAGWKAIGFEERMSWSPPFGYYDRPDVMARLTPRRTT
jgi:gluconate 2-dehydrogenase gamma chain